MTGPRPMDALRLAAQHVGAVIVITSSCDARDANGKRYLRDQCPSRLRRLAVVKPNRDAASRSVQVTSGDLLCIASLDEITVDEAAVLLANHESLNPRRQAA